jgi:hypothetical protein
MNLRDQAARDDTANKPSGVIDLSLEQQNHKYTGGRSGQFEFRP